MAKAVSVQPALGKYVPAVMPHKLTHNESLVAWQFALAVCSDIAGGFHTPQEWLTRATEHLQKLRLEEVSLPNRKRM